MLEGGARPSQAPSPPLDGPDSTISRRSSEEIRGWHTRPPGGVAGIPGQLMRRRLPPPRATSGEWRWWLAGAALALLVLGPALAPGSLLSLDLVVLPRLPVPAGLWGLGPGLPQRVPLGIPLAWLSTLVGGPVTGKVLIGLTVLVGFVGGSRLGCGRAFWRADEPFDAPWLCRAATGLLWALSPFLLTRLGAGQLNVALAAALLPWSFRPLLRPTESAAATLLAASALSVTGAPGGALAAVLVVVGLVAERGRRLAPVVAALVISFLPWLVPDLSVLAAGAHVAGAGGFPTDLAGPLGWARLLAGAGFWRGPSQVGGSGWLGAVLGLALTVLAILGHRDLPERWRARLLAVGVVGLALSAVSGIGVLRAPYRWLTDLAVGAPFRESQRAIVLWLLWLVPAAVLGARRAGRWLLAHHGARAAGWAELLVASPAVAALLLGGPGLWGIGGRLRPVDLPPGWARARAAVRADPGPVLALPWAEYLRIPFAGGRVVLNPLPDYLGGDVISSYDPLLGHGQEQVDARVPHVVPLMAALAGGRPISADLARLGIRYVVLVHQELWPTYDAPLAGDPGLADVLHTPSIDVWAVRAWTGPVVRPSGVAQPLHHLVAPLATTSAPPGSVWLRAGAPGWLQGLRSAHTTPEGLLELPGGSGIVWFWPAAACLAADLLVLAAIVAASIRVFRQRRSLTEIPFRNSL